MGWFKRRKQEQEASVAERMTAAVSTIMKLQTDQMLGSVEFMSKLQDLNAKKAAQIMGSRGGRISMERKRKAKLAARPTPPNPSCRLCVNPLARGLTWQEIMNHNAHSGEDGQDALPFAQEHQEPESAETGN